MQIDQTLNKLESGSRKISFLSEAEQLGNDEIGVEGQLSQMQELRSQTLGRAVNRVDQVCQTSGLQTWNPVPRHCRADNQGLCPRARLHAL